MTVTVELFTSPACNRCASARKTLRHVVEGFDDDRLTWRAVDVLDELDYAVALGVLATPALAIDGELVFTALPSASTLRRALDQRLAGV
jgi:protein-disulfide isomerase